MTGTCSLLRRV